MGFEGAVNIGFRVNVKFIVSFSCGGGGIKGVAAGHFLEASVA